MRWTYWIFACALAMGCAPRTKKYVPNRDGGAPDSGVVDPPKCTDDPQDVDLNGKLFLCPPEAECIEGQCVPACDAAAQQKGATGCDFWAPDPPFYNNGFGGGFDGACYAVFLANARGTPAQITVTRNGQTYNVSDFGRIPKGVGPKATYEPIPAQGLPPNEVAVLFLSHKPGVKNGASSLECPVKPAILQDAAVSGGGRGKAFHITVDSPVNAYDILPYGGADSYLPSASLLFPATAWGTNYFGLGPHLQGGGTVWLLVVGSTNSTTVKVAPPVQLKGGSGLLSAPAGVTSTFNLDAGEILQWMGDGTGAILQSDQPVAVFTGNTYLGVSTSTSGPGGEDSAHQQLQHIKALGSEYVGPGVASRMASMAPESVLYRIQGVVDGTTITWDPPAGDRPQTLKAGQVVEFETKQIFTVRSQDEDHPFQLTHYFSGAVSQGRPGCSSKYGSSCNLGDEEWVILLPPQQFARHYVFFVDPSYATTNLVVTRKKGSSGFSDVKLECLGTISGWKAVGGGDYEVAYVDLVVGEKPVAQCGTSRHEATSEGLFGIMVWGTDWYSSYGYPAGGNSHNINQVDVPPPS